MWRKHSPGWRQTDGTRTKLTLKPTTFPECQRERGTRNASAVPSRASCMMPILSMGPLLKTLICICIPPRSRAKRRQCPTIPRGGGELCTICIHSSFFQYFTIFTIVHDTFFFGRRMDRSFIVFGSIVVRYRPVLQECKGPQPQWSVGYDAADAAALLRGHPGAPQQQADNSVHQQQQQQPPQQRDNHILQQQTGKHLHQDPELSAAGSKEIRQQPDQQSPARYIESGPPAFKPVTSWAQRVAQSSFSGSPLAGVVSPDKSLSVGDNTPDATGAPSGKAKFLVTPRGLFNSGNTCYMNVVLQSLLFCPVFYYIIASLFPLSSSSSAFLHIFRRISMFHVL